MERERENRLDRKKRWIEEQRGVRYRDRSNEREREERETRCMGV